MSKNIADEILSLPHILLRCVPVGGIALEDGLVYKVIRHFKYKAWIENYDLRQQKWIESVNGVLPKPSKEYQTRSSHFMERAERKVRVISEKQLKLALEWQRNFWKGIGDESHEG